MTPCSRLHSLRRALPDPEARVKRASARAPGSLATWPIPRTTGYDPKKFDKITSADGDTTPINDPNFDNISDFSKITRENTGLFGVSTMLETSVSHVSHGEFPLQGESKDSMQSGNRCWTERKRRFCDQCCRVDVKEKVDGTILRVILFRLTENSILMNEISEKTWNEELDKLFLRKIQFREIFLNESNMEIQKSERRNAEYALIASRRELESQRRQLLEANQWADKPQRERIHLCGELGMKDHLHQECTQEVAKKLKN